MFEDVLYDDVLSCRTNLYPKMWKFWGFRRHIGGPSKFMDYKRWWMSYKYWSLDSDFLNITAAIYVVCIQLSN